METKDMVQTLDSEISRLTNARNLLAGEAETDVQTRRASGRATNTATTGRRGPGRPKGSTNNPAGPRGGARPGAGRPRGSVRSDESSAKAE